MKRVTIVIHEDDGTTTTVTTCGVLRDEKVKIERVPSGSLTDFRALDRLVKPEPFRLSLSLIAHPGEDGKCLVVTVEPEEKA